VTCFPFRGLLIYTRTVWELLFNLFTMTAIRWSQKVRFPIFYLEYKQVAVSNTWVRYRHTCSLFFEAVAISVEAVMAVDQRVRALVVKWCVLQT
jgi:hypothetical protein